jgi:hypothetical protein
MGFRQGLADGLSRLITGDQSSQRAAEAQKLADLVMESYRFGPAIIPPEEMVRRLGEMDSQYLDLLVRMFVQNVPIMGPDDTEMARVTVIKESRSMYTNDVLTGHIIDLWTDFGFGMTVDIVPREKSAVKVWDEFWKAPRNRPVLNPRDIHGLSRDILTDGEVFFVFFVSTLDGTATLRTIPSEQMIDRVTDPDDGQTVIYWIREWTPKKDGVSQKVYYRDWTASDEDVIRVHPPEGMKDGADGRSNTTAIVLPAQHKKRNGRGWPLMTAGFPWSRSYRDFLQDRAAVAKAVASIVDKVKIKGNDRTLDVLRRRLESTMASTDRGIEGNPPAVAGSRFLENEGVDLTRMSLTTGAVDAEKDGGAFLNQATIAGRIFPHWAGRGESFRLATATSMETPVLRAFNRYQLFWSSVWEDMVRIILDMAEKYGGKGTFADKEADVNTDSILQTDLTVVATIIGALDDLYSAGLITEQTAAPAADQLIRMSLSTLGVKDLDAVIGTARTFEDIPETPEPDPNQQPQFDQNGNPIPPNQNGNPPANGNGNGNPGGSGNGNPKTSNRPAEIRSTVESLLDLFARKLIERSAEDELETGVRSYIRGLWSGEMERFEFVSGMSRLMERRLTEAWIEGAEEVGIKADELTEEELAALTQLIADEFQYILNIASDIEDNSREKGGALGPLISRAVLWGNRAVEARNKGKLYAQNNPKLKWVSKGKNPCTSCRKLNGKVKRASYWREKGISPQDPENSHLECEGWHCHCEMQPTDEALSKGPLPSLP